MTTAVHCSTPVNSAGTRWPTTRILFTRAGTITTTSATLAATLSPWWLLLTAAVGLNQLLYATVGACPASLLIDRVRRPGHDRSPTVNGSVADSPEET